MPVDENEQDPEIPKEFRDELPGEPGGEFEETSAAEEWRRFALVAGYLSAGGITMVAATGAGYLIGGQIDRRLGWDLGFAAILAMVGFVAGVYQMWRFIQTLQRQQERS